MDEESRLKLRSDLQKTKNQIISLQQQADKGINFNSKKDSNNLEDMAKSAKRFALSLISIRGAYALLSKASQSYMATDEKTTKQMEANWIGLGTILKSAIDLIVNLFKKAVTSILYFMSVLTGVNYIDKANTAILKKQTEATNNLTKANDKLTASFDEMSILNSPNSTSNNSGVDTDALFSLNDIGDDTRKTIEKIAEALQPVYDILKDIIKWASKNPEAVLGILGGAGLLTMLGKVIGIAGTSTVVGTGLAGILGALLAIASVWVITIEIKRIVEANNELQETLDNLDEMSGSILDNNEKINNFYRDFIKNNDNSADSINAMNDRLLNQIDTLSEHNNNIETAIDDLGLYEKMIWNATGATTENGLVMADNTTQIFRNIASLIEAEKQGKLTKEQSERLTEQLQHLTTETDLATLSTEQLSAKYQITTGEAQMMKDQIKLVGDEHVNYMDKTYGATKETEDLTTAIKNIPNKKSVEIEVETEKATKKTSSWWKDIVNNALVLPINSIASSLGIKVKLPKLAVGGIVNNPGRGVPIGANAITGEAGAEGVIPLTDSQAMEELGQTIGRYININLTNITQLNNRQIAREQKKINAQNDFAMNK